MTSAEIRNWPAWVLVLCLGLVGFTVAAGTDWPTYMHDNQRSGMASSDLPADLVLLWTYRSSHPPAVAWPGAAQSDWWRRRGTPEPARYVFDWAYEVVAANGRVYMGRSSDDQVVCLDLATGQEQWRFFAQGPVRLAPSVADGRVVFGADDGVVYALDADDGGVLWRSSIAEAASAAYLPGNGRIISPYPVRTGVLLHEGRGYFCSGIFPRSVGVWGCTIDLADGSIVASRRLSFSYQGYLQESVGTIHTMTMRKQKAQVIAKLAGGAAEHAAPGCPGPVPARYPFAFIGTPGQRIGGGDGEVALLAADDGRVLWSHPVEGKARSLAIADDRLLVSTDRGVIYCFGRGPAAAAQSRRLPATAGEPAPAAIRVAESMLAANPIRKGYGLVCHAEAAGGALLRALAAVRPGFRWVGLTTDVMAAESLRSSLAAQEFYGQVVVQVVDSDTLPFVRGLFNVITDGGILEGPVDMPQPVSGLLVPGRGHAFFSDTTTPDLTALPVPGAGAWTHMYADAGNSACSGDSAVGHQLRLQWFGRPGPEHMIDRHLRGCPPLVSAGRLFVPGRDYVFGVDAWNGRILWERPVDSFRRVGALRDSGNMVCSDDWLYCASGSVCLRLDAETGNTEQRFGLPPPIAPEHQWGYLGLAGSRLIGSAVTAGTTYREYSYRAIYAAGYGDSTRVACSDGVFAVDRFNGKPQWTYRPTGAIWNPTIAISGARLFFVESRKPETLKAAPARMLYPELWEAAGADLVCLDVGTGAPVWRRPLPAQSGVQTVFLLARDPHVVLAYSRNHVAESAKKPTLHYELRVFDAATGGPSWAHTRNTGKRPNLDHGEQDLHPAIVGRRLVVEPRVYDIGTGEEEETLTGRRGCGTISASAQALYCRASTPSAYDLQSGARTQLTAVTRPGCWINMIPADGLLLVPEGSSGCTCNYAIQASMGFAPVR